MKRTRAALLAAALLTLSAAAGWTAARVWQLRAGSGRTAVCVPGVMEDALPLSGVVLRQERPLEFAGALRYDLYPPGERLPAGAEAVLVCETEEELFRARLRVRLREALAREERGSVLSPGEAARALSAAAARQDPAVSDLAGELRLALWGADPARQDGLRAEIDELETAGADRAAVRVPASGLFYPDRDGWEALTFSEAEALSPGELSRRLGRPAASLPGARLVTGSAWRYLALADDAHAGQFRPGDELDLVLPGGGRSCRAEVLSVRPGESGLSLVTFGCSEGLSETASLRRAELTAVFRRWEGLRLPAAAVREENGETFVLRVSGPLSVVTPVTVLAGDGGGVLVASTGLFPGAEVLLP